MEMCFKILSQEKRVTQRELFYKLLCVSPDCFSSQLQVNRTIQGLFNFIFLRIGFCSIERMVLNLCVTDVVGLLRCSRYSLGIMASSRGIVAGRLLLQANNWIVEFCFVLQIMKQMSISIFMLFGFLVLCDRSQTKRWWTVLNVDLLGMQFLETWIYWTDWLWRQMPGTLLLWRRYLFILVLFIKFLLGFQFPVSRQ